MNSPKSFGTYVLVCTLMVTPLALPGVAQNSGAAKTGSSASCHGTGWAARF